MKLLLIGIAAPGVFNLATFTLTDVRRRMQIGALVGLSVLLAVFMAAIEEIDHPCSGIIAIAPTDITREAHELAAGFATHYPGIQLPCDRTGLQQP